MPQQLTRKEIIAKVSQKTGFTHRQIGEIFEGVLEEIITQLASGRDIELRRFGSFQLERRAAKKGRNPRFPEQEVQIPERVVVKFKPARILREKVIRLLPFVKARENL